MSERILGFPATVDSIGTTRDKSFKIVLITQDKATLSPDQKAQMMDLLDEYVSVGIKVSEPGEVDAEVLDLPDYKPDFPGEKTPSQRLRGVLYVLWEQLNAKGKVTEDADAFYRRQMNRIIDSVKAKLDR